MTHYCVGGPFPMLTAQWQGELAGPQEQSQVFKDVKRCPPAGWQPGPTRSKCIFHRHQPTPLHGALCCQRKHLHRREPSFRVPCKLLELHAARAAPWCSDYKSGPSHFTDLAEQHSPGIPCICGLAYTWRFQVHLQLHENAKLPQQATCRHAHLIHAAERQAGDVRDNNCSHGRVRDLLQSLRNCPGCSCHDP